MLYYKIHLKFHRGGQTMEVTPIPGGVILFGGYLAVLGLIPALALGVLSPWPGLVFWLAWLGLTVLASRYGMATIRIHITEQQLVARGGTIFPWEICLPMDQGARLYRMSTPLMRVLGCCLVRVTTPSGGVWLPAITQMDVRAIARLVGRGLEDEA